jgi:hypothetical protein
MDKKIARLEEKITYKDGGQIGVIYDKSNKSWGQTLPFYTFLGRSEELMSVNM